MKIRATFTTYGVVKQSFEMEILDEELRQFMAMWDNFTLYDALNYAKGIAASKETVIIDKQYPLYCNLTQIPIEGELSEIRLPGTTPESVLGQLKVFAEGIEDGAVSVVIKAGTIIGFKKVKEQGGLTKTAPVRDIASMAIDEKTTGNGAKEAKP